MIDFNEATALQKAEWNEGKHPRKKTRDGRMVPSARSLNWTYI